MGELGYDVHVENKYCTTVYHKLINIGSNYGLRDAGFRALYSLGCEKGKILGIDKKKKMNFQVNF